MYEIQHVAYSCLPRFTVANYQLLSVGKPARLTLLLRNTVERDITVRLRAVTTAAGVGRVSGAGAEEAKVDEGQGRRTAARCGRGCVGRVAPPRPAAMCECQGSGCGCRRTTR